MIGRLPHTIFGSTSPASMRISVRPDAARGVGHVDVGIGAVAGDDAGALDHGVGHLGVEVERHRDRHVRRDPADAIQKLAFAVVVVLGHHRAVQREQHGVAALLDLVDDGRRHLLVGGLGDQAGRMGGRRHRHGELRTGLARHLDEAAQRGVGAFGFLDGRRARSARRHGKRIRWAWAAARTCWSRASSSPRRIFSPPSPSCCCQVLEQSTELRKAGSEALRRSANQLRANLVRCKKATLNRNTKYG